MLVIVGLSNTIFKFEVVVVIALFNVTCVELFIATTNLFSVISVGIVIVSNSLTISPIFTLLVFMSIFITALLLTVPDILALYLSKTITGSHGAYLATDIWSSLV